MKIQGTFKKGGYSAEIASKYIGNKKPIYSLSTKVYPQQRFENNQPTGEIIAYKAWFVQEGLPPFMVKFESEVTLPNFMTVITFENLEACEIRYDVYFKASDIKEVK
ncbi:hypothetical protein [Staphylococcus epidermidis]|uniref:hypothetical protein n=1 Tax=Staphylococcus epidermidis TaxID=1282 RepID=UPI0011A25561|nr:hypothetical protein [Staphylococcus epidermidis]